MAEASFKVPTIMECLHYTHDMLPDETPPHRIVRNYEIDINLTGDRTMTVNGKVYEIEPGSVVCRIPGQEVESCGNFNMYTLTLDFSGRAIERGDRNSFSAIQPLDGSYYWEVIPVCFIPGHSADLLKMYRRLSLIWETPNKKEEADRLLASILHLLLADAFSARLRVEDEISPVSAVITYINEHYAEKLTLDRLSTVAARNKSYLVRLFRKETGTTPIDYLNHVRLSNAKKMLLNSGIALKSIADHCGFENAAYFTLRFEKEFGVTPGEYRTENQIAVLQIDTK